MAMKLRKKAPFFCRAKSVDGKTLIHIDGVLTEADGDLCPVHAQELADRRKRFYNAPILPVQRLSDSKYFSSEAWEVRMEKGPIWPN